MPSVSGDLAILSGEQCARLWATMQRLSLIADFEERGNQSALEDIRMTAKRWTSRRTAALGNNPMPTPANTTESEYVTVKAAAIQTRRSERTIRNWCDNGTLAGAEKDPETDRWRIPRAALKEHR